MSLIPLHRPARFDDELNHLDNALEAIQTGAHSYTKKCSDALKTMHDGSACYLTPSCSAGLEMATLLLGIGSGDEVIMPSFSYPSTANAVILRGATPVFVDIEPDTLNLDANKVAAAVTDRTRAIMPVHYAGVGCDMRTLKALAEDRGLFIIEDAAHAICAQRDGLKLGAIGDLGVFSFHRTKNISCGEGGAILINNPVLRERAEWVYNKGTDAAAFSRGDVAFYQWQTTGVSGAMPETSAALLHLQLVNEKKIHLSRRNTWQYYHQALQDAEAKGLLQRPGVPEACEHNGHIYYVLLPSLEIREIVQQAMRADDVEVAGHYRPLHCAPGAAGTSRQHDTLAITETFAPRLLRLPLWAQMPTSVSERVVQTLTMALMKT